MFSMYIPSGNIRQPKYGHLKDLHNLLKSMEKILVHGEHNDTAYAKNVTVRFTSHANYLFFFLYKRGKKYDLIQVLPTYPTDAEIIDLYEQ